MSLNSDVRLGTVCVNYANNYMIDSYEST